MACKYHYKRKGIEPCATWGQKRGWQEFFSDFTDLDPRTGEIRQVYTSLYHFDIFASEFKKFQKF